jgi:hypothetical protein
MANIQSANSWYVDSTGNLTGNFKIVYIVMTATAASGVIVFQDVTTSANRMDLRVATSGATQVFDFSECPISCPNGIKVSTLTNAVATFVGRAG